MIYICRTWRVHGRFLRTALKKGNYRLDNFSRYARFGNDDNGCRFEAHKGKQNNNMGLHAAAGLIAVRLRMLEFYSD